MKIVGLDTRKLSETSAIAHNFNINSSFLLVVKYRKVAYLFDENHIFVVPYKCI